MRTTFGPKGRAPRAPAAPHTGPPRVGQQKRGAPSETSRAERGSASVRTTFGPKGRGARRPAASGAPSETSRAKRGSDVARQKMARETGLEPAASAVTGRRSNQLSYSRKLVERAGEPHRACHGPFTTGLPPRSQARTGSFSAMRRPAGTAGYGGRARRPAAPLQVRRMKSRLPISSPLWRRMP